MSSLQLKLLEHHPLGKDAYWMKFERPDWSWEAGQLISLSGENPLDQRDYSIASGIDQETLDVVYRFIPHGVVTPYLCSRKPGDFIHVNGPYGRFTVQDPSRPLLFCATGTGIAPCRAFVQSFPNLDITLLHGVRTEEDLYFREEFSAIHYFPFTSREPLNGVTSRLTDHLHDMELPENAQAYLCGGNEMIYEAEDILIKRGIAKSDIFHEPYYYRAYDA